MCLKSLLKTDQIQCEFCEWMVILCPVAIFMAYCIGNTVSVKRFAPPSKFSITLDQVGAGLPPMVLFPFLVWPCVTTTDQRKVISVKNSLLQMSVQRVEYDTGEIPKEHLQVHFAEEMNILWFSTPEILPNVSVVQNFWYPLYIVCSIGNTNITVELNIPVIQPTYISRHLVWSRPTKICLVKMNLQTDTTSESASVQLLISLINP